MRLLTGVAVCLALAAPVHGQGSGELALQFNHVALHVTDIERSATFYGRTLQLDELARASVTPGVRWFSLGGGTELHLIGPEYYRGEAVHTNRAVHMALTTPRFDELLRYLERAGVAYGDWSGTHRAVQRRSDGVRQVFLQDPDGYWIEINSAGEPPA